MIRGASRQGFYEAVFTHSPILAIVLVELLSLLYVSWFGQPNLTAAVGYASTVSV